jgi:prepilin-type N-terminal cleavage/methylation domain-containing protein
MTSLTGNKGFSLIEILIVTTIVAILVSVAAISIKAARPSDTQILFNDIRNTVKSAIDLAQLTNIDIRIDIVTVKKDSEDEKNEEVYHVLQIKKLNSENGKWEKKLPFQLKQLQWENALVSNNFDTIFISPNGFITPSIISVKFDDELYEFETIKL